MITNTSGGKEYYRAKQEADNSNSNKKTSSSKATFSTTTSSSRQWAGFRNPRIVRVSRSFGGKDRHSKVFTVKGLRDRRIRLSVPTAIQLYDLQDRLGLSQPSKVIDWLIENTKDDIDELPPLQMPLNGDFSQFHQPNSLVINPHDLNSSSSHLSFSQFFATPKHGTKHGNSDERMKGKEVGREENDVENGGLNFFPIPQPSFPPFPYNPYYNWEPSNLSLSQFGSSQGFPIPQTENSSSSHSSLSLLPSSLALPPVSQLFLAPSPSLFPPYTPTLGESTTADPRQFSHFQFLNSSSQHVLPNALMPGLNLIDSQNKTFALNLNSSKFHSSLHNSEGHDSQPNKGKGGSTF